MISINQAILLYIHSITIQTMLGVFMAGQRNILDFKNNIPNRISINGLSFTKDIFIESYSLKLLVMLKLKEYNKIYRISELETGINFRSVQFYITTDKIIEYYISGNIYKGKTTRTKDGKEGSSSFKSDNEKESNIYRR